MVKRLFKRKDAYTRSLKLVWCFVDGLGYGKLVHNLRFFHKDYGRSGSMGLPFGQAVAVWAAVFNEVGPIGGNGPVGGLCLE